MSSFAEEQLREQLDEARDFIKRQGQALDHLQEMPALIGTIYGAEFGRGLVALRDSMLELPLPSGCEVGTQVRLSPDSNQVLNALTEPVCFGEQVTVTAVTEREVTFESNGGIHSAAIAKRMKNRPEPGDRVRLDPSAQVALVNLGKDSKAFSVDKTETIAWSDVGGHEEAKEAIREAVEYPVKFSTLYQSYGQKVSKGILLFGPPGCGKTLLAKATANALTGNEDGGFIYVRGPEVLSKWVGEAEATIRGLFTRAKAFKQKTGRVAVIFIDEADALLQARGQSGPGHTMSTTIVPTFLAEMDGIGDSGAFVMLSTNRPDTLDPAVVRDGRIDRKIRIGRPDRDGALEIFRIAMRGRPASDVQALEARAMELLHATDLSLYELGFAGEPVHLRFSDLISGAMITGIVNRATAIAIRRDRDANSKCSGITTKDIEIAILASFKEALDTDHSEVLAEKCAQLGKQPTHIRKVISNAKAEEPGFVSSLAFGAPIEVTRRASAAN